jgi:hypothetical protein
MFYLISLKLFLCSSPAADFLLHLFFFMKGAQPSSFQKENLSPMGFSHRSTLKQSNKPFKSKHASKSSLKIKGKVSKNIGTSNSVMLKRDKRNSLKQRQQEKKKEMLELQKQFIGAHAVPKTIAVVALCPV